MTSNALPSASKLQQQMLSSELAKILAEVGFSTIFSGNLAQARIIFETLRTFRPDCNSHVVGFALIAIAGKEAKVAIVELQNVLRQNPDNKDVQALLGLALFMNGNYKESTEIVNEITASNAEPSVLNFSKALREELAYRVSPADLQWAKQS